MAYGLRKNGYAVRSGGYAATTNCPDCCGPGGDYVRAKECCSLIYKWFNTQFLDCEATIGMVFATMAHCWSVTGPILTRQEVEDQYPADEIVDVYTSTCIPEGCGARPECPDCESCCYITGNETCAIGSCACSRGPCVCGRRWKVTWSVSSRAEQWNPDGTMENFVSRTGSGESTFTFYEELVDGEPQCVLRLVAAFGSVHVHNEFGIPSGHPDVEDYTVTINMLDPLQRPHLEGFRGCGENIGDLILMVNGLTQNLEDCAFALPCVSVPPCDPEDPEACEYHCHRVNPGGCDGVANGCEIDLDFVRMLTCFGATHQRVYESRYDYTGCPVQSRCNEDYSFAVTVQEQCLEVPVEGSALTGLGGGTGSFL